MYNVKLLRNNNSVVTIDIFAERFRRYLLLDFTCTKVSAKSVLWYKLAWSDETKGVRNEISMEVMIEKSFRLFSLYRMMNMKLVMITGISNTDTHSLKYKIDNAMDGRRKAKLQPAYTSALNFFGQLCPSDISRLPFRIDTMLINKLNIPGRIPRYNLLPWLSTMTVASDKGVASFPWPQRINKISI